MTTIVVTLVQAGVEAVRWTLQTPDKEGKTFSWVPEGIETELGSGAGFARSYTHRGFRRRLELSWEYGTTSMREEFSGTWGAAVSHPTAAAVSEILQWGAMGDLKVTAAEGMGLPDFYARAIEQEVALKDIKGVAHSGLALVLDAVTLIPNIRLDATLGWGDNAWGNAPWGS